jgi:hypothetical protein
MARLACSAAWPSDPRATFETNVRLSAFWGSKAVSVEDAHTATAPPFSASSKASARLVV